MTTIDFEVTMSKVKVTFNDKMVTANFLENNYLLTFHISQYDWSWLVDVPYWLWGHQVKFEGHSDLEWKTGFRWLSWKPFITKSSYFTCKLVKTIRWPLCLIFGSLGQRSRLQWPLIIKRCTLVILNTICFNRVF